MTDTHFTEIVVGGWAKLDVVNKCLHCLHLFALLALFALLVNGAHQSGRGQSNGLHLQDE